MFLTKLLVNGDFVDGHLSRVPKKLQFFFIREKLQFFPRLNEQ